MVNTFLVPVKMCLSTFMDCEKSALLGTLPPHHSQMGNGMAEAILQNLFLALSPAQFDQLTARCVPIQLSFSQTHRLTRTLRLLQL